MATATYGVQTGSAGDLSLKELGRKTTAGVKKSAQFMTEEWGWLNDLKDFEIAPSLREMTFEADVVEGTGAAFIPEGGKEARPSSPAPVTATITFLLLNKRWTISRTTQMMLGGKGARGYLENQFKFQGKKATEAIHRKLGINFYGFSTGTQAKISSGEGGTTPVLKDLYGVSGLGSTSHNRRCVDQYVVGTVASQNLDYLAATTGAAIRSISGVTAKARATNTLTISAAWTGAAADDLIVYANNVENTTLAAGTEDDLNLTGLLDGATSTSLHSISGSTYSKWNAGSDTTGGRFTGVKLHKARQVITNEGGGTADTVIWAQGVERDVLSQLQAGLRFSDAYAMEMDGSPKAKGLQFKTSRLVPDGYVFVMDSKNSVHRQMVVPQIDMPGMEDGDKIQDDSGFLYSADFLIGMPWTNRANFYYFSGLTQS